MTTEQIIEETVDQLMRLTIELDKVDVLEDSPKTIEATLERAVSELNTVIEVLEAVKE